VVKFLLDMGADVNQKYNSGNTPLSIAFEYKKNTV
jgi:ankyrin repeat protein